MPGPIQNYEEAYTQPGFALYKNADKHSDISKSVFQIRNQDPKPSRTSFGNRKVTLKAIDTVTDLSTPNAETETKDFRMEVQISAPIGNEDAVLELIQARFLLMQKALDEGNLQKLFHLGSVSLDDLTITVEPPEPEL